MSKNGLRIHCGMMSPCVGPIFKIDISATDEADKSVVYRCISKMMDMAVESYNAKMVTTDKHIDAYIDEEYPFGVCCFLRFCSHNDAMEYFANILNAIQ